MWSSGQWVIWCFDNYITQRTTDIRHLTSCAVWPFYSQFHRSGTQISQRGDLRLDGLYSLFKKFCPLAHEVKILAYRLKNIHPVSTGGVVSPSRKNQSSQHAGYVELTCPTASLGCRYGETNSQISFADLAFMSQGIELDRAETDSGIRPTATRIG